MRLLLGLSVLMVTLEVLHSAPEDQPMSISDDTLKRESAQMSLSGSCCQVKAAFSIQLSLTSIWKR